MPDLYHSRLNELIEYACQTALMRHKPTTEVKKYGYFSQHEHNLTDLPGVRIDASSADDADEVWLSVERLRENPVPHPANPLLDVWLNAVNDPNKKPELKNSLSVQTLRNAGMKIEISGENPLSPAQIISFSSFAIKENLTAEFEKYLKEQWQPWSEAEKPRRKTISLYGKLFTLKQELEGGIVDAQLELIWGIGMAIWQTNGANIRFPLITKAVELSLNEKTMAIEIRPRELDPRVELEIYANLDNPGVPKVQKAAREFFAATQETISPFENSTFEGLLRSAVAFLDSKGVYLPDETADAEEDDSLPKAESNLKVTDSWVLFARPRGASLFIQDLERFQQILKQGDGQIELPKAAAAIVTEPSNESEDFELPSFRGISMVSGSSANTGGKPQDLFFPLPFNDEQVRIVQLLESSDGVVVQGPPGTGKTHTIANIICHYLALGKRVLVTSMREPALTVLQEKLPADIQPLAVSLLMNERDGMKQFQYAIEKIASIVQLVNKDNQKREIAEQEKAIDEYHFKIAKCDRQIADWAEKNLNKFQIDGEFLEPREAAGEVVKNSGEIVGFEDSISIEPQFDAQFSNEVIQQLREARRRLGEDLIYLDCTLPEISALPDVRDVLQTHQNLSRLAELEEQVDAGEVPHLANSSEETFKSAQITLHKIDSLKKSRQEINAAGANWTASMLQRLRANRQEDIVGLFCGLGVEIESAVKENRKYLSKPVFLPDGFEQNPELIEGVKNLSEGNRPFGLLGMFGKSAERKNRSRQSKF